MRINPRIAQMAPIVLLSVALCLRGSVGSAGVIEVDQFVDGMPADGAGSGAVQYWWGAAQTFTVGKAGRLAAVGVKALTPRARPHTATGVFIELRRADENHQPTGDVLATGNLQVERIPEVYPEDFIDVDLGSIDPLIVRPGERYALAFMTFNDDGATAYLQATRTADFSGDPYPAGRYSYLFDRREPLAELEFNDHYDLMFRTLVEQLLPGDVNLDDQVDLSDFARLKHHYGQAGGWTLGDLDGDGQVALPDFVILKDNYGARETAAAVPEPSGWLLGMVALCCCAASCKSRRVKMDPQAQK